MFEPYRIRRERVSLPARFRSRRYLNLSVIVSGRQMNDETALHSVAEWTIFQLRRLRDDGQFASSGTQGG